MKKRYIKIFVVFIFLLLIIGQPLIRANGGLPIEDEPSELAKQFKEVWLPYILDIFTALIGTSAGLLIVKTIFNKSLNLLGFTKDKLEKTNELVSKSNLINEDTKKLFDDKVTKALDKIEYLENALLKSQEDLKISQEEQSKTNKQILDILKIAFLNNPELVRNGYASEIAKVINCEEE